MARSWRLTYSLVALIVLGVFNVVLVARASEEHHPTSASLPSFTLATGGTGTPTIRPVRPTRTSRPVVVTGGASTPTIRPVLPTRTSRPDRVTGGVRTPTLSPVLPSPSRSPAVVTGGIGTPTISPFPVTDGVGTLSINPVLPETFPPGAVLALQGTPHLWVADAGGVLHWAGDTLALAGRFVNWNWRAEVHLATLRTLPRGDPWLSAGLLKDGDPVYLVKWERDWERPQLLHIQSLADVELFGINEHNYGNFVLDRAAWEAHYGLAMADLARGNLVPVVQ